MVHSAEVACLGHEGCPRLRRHPGRSARRTRPGWPGMGSAASRPRCPTGGKVLLRTASLRVYSVDGIGRACLFSSGRPYGLSGEDESFGEEEGKEFPLIAAAGPMVAAWIEGFYDTNFSEVFMRVINLRSRMLVRAVPFYTRPDVLRVAARNGAVVLGFAGCDREDARQHPRAATPARSTPLTARPSIPAPPLTRVISFRGAAPDRRGIRPRRDVPADHRTDRLVA